MLCYLFTFGKAEDVDVIMRIIVVKGEAERVDP